MIAHPGFVIINFIGLLIIFLVICFFLIKNQKKQNKKILYRLTLICLISLLYSGIFPLIYIQANLESIMGMILPVNNEQILLILEQNINDIYLLIIPEFVFFITASFTFILFSKAKKT